jgi:hypothetical protein
MTVDDDHVVPGDTQPIGQQGPEAPTAHDHDIHDGLPFHAAGKPAARFCQQHSAFGLNADLAGVFLPVKPNGFKQESIPAAESPVFAQRGD